MLNEAHTAHRDLPVRAILNRMRHDGCGGRGGKVELLTGIEGASSWPVRKITLIQLQQPLHLFGAPSTLSAKATVRLCFIPEKGPRPPGKGGTRTAPARKSLRAEHAEQRNDREQRQAANNEFEVALCPSRAPSPSRCYCYRIPSHRPCPDSSRSRRLSATNSCRTTARRTAGRMASSKGRPHSLRNSRQGAPRAPRRPIVRRSARARRS